MPDDQNTTQNPTSEKTTPKDGQDSIPPSPTSFDSAQDLPESPTADAPILPIDSESFDHTQDLRPAEVPPETIESRF